MKNCLPNVGLPVEVEGLLTLENWPLTDCMACAVGHEGREYPPSESGSYGRPAPGGSMQE